MFIRVKLHLLQINECDVAVQAKTRQRVQLRTAFLVGKEGGDDSSGMPNTRLGQTGSCISIQHKIISRRVDIFEHGIYLKPANSILRGGMNAIGLSHRELRELYLIYRMIQDDTG